MKKTIVFVFILTTVAALGQNEIRQRSTTKGFTAGAQAHVLGWASDYFLYLDKNAPTGYGGGIIAGYGVTELIEPYISFNATAMGTEDIDAESFSFTHFDVGVRFNFAGTVSPIRPYVQAGYSYVKGKVNKVINGATYDDIEFFGGKPHVGGGLRYFVTVPIAIFADGIFTIGKKSSATLNGNKVSDKPDVTTFRVNIGVSFNISALTK